MNSILNHIKHIKTYQKGTLNGSFTHYVKKIKKATNIFT